MEDGFHGNMGRISPDLVGGDWNMTGLCDG